MFSDPINLQGVFGSPGVDLKKINQDKYSSEYFYRGNGSEIRLFIRHSNYVDKKRNGMKVDRHNIELVQTLFASGTGFAQDSIRKCYIVFEVDPNDNQANSIGIATTLSAYLAAGTNATKMGNYES